MKIVNALKVLPVLLVLAGCGSLTGVAESVSTLNGFRASHGRTALQSDGGLTAMAQSHAADMAQRDALDHNGFMAQRGPRGARAENVAYGCKDSPCVIQQWASSSGHRANMLRTDISKCGLASAVSKSGKRYWALELGE